MIINSTPHPPPRIESEISVLKQNSTGRTITKQMNEAYEKPEE